MKRVFLLIAAVIGTAGLGTLKAQYISTSTSAYSGSIYHTGGSLGVGTSSPSYLLDVAGTARTTLATYLATGATTYYVGIGTTSPSYKLDVAGSTRSTATSYFEAAGLITTPAFMASVTSSGAYVALFRRAYSSGEQYLTFQHYNASSAYATYAQIGSGVTASTASAESGYLSFYTKSSGTLAERARITSAGYLGLGTTAPSYKLDVAGNIRATYTSYFQAAGLITTPAFMGTITSSGAYAALFRRSYSSGEQYLTFQHYNASSAYATYAQIASGVTASTASAQSGYLAFYTSSSGTLAEKVRITSDGNVGIGTTTPGSYKLAVEGTIGAREVKVTTDTWADFVFNPSYRLPPLSEVEQFVKTNNHLPDIPSETEVKANGVSLGEMNAKLLQKVEELTLYVIELQRQVDELKQQQLATSNQ